MNNFLNIIGIYTVSKSCFNFYNRFIPLIYDRQTFIYKQNQNEKWALVAGSTDGIGLEFAKKLNSFNYNLILISRNEEKLKKVKEQLNNNVQVQILIHDFSQNNKEIKIDQNLDIIVNSVGVSDLNLLQDQKNPVIETNIQSQVLLSKLMMKQKKTNFINIGSIMSNHAFPYLTNYSATKSFNKQYFNSLNQEIQLQNLNHKIINFTPFYVLTKMSNYKKDYFSISTEEFVNSALKQINYGKSEANGHWKHELIDILLNIKFIKQKYIKDLHEIIERIKNLRIRRSKK